MAKISLQPVKHLSDERIGFAPVLLILLLGLVFIGQSYAFYNINHFKLVAALAGCFVFLFASIALYSHPVASKSTRSAGPSSGISYLVFLLLLLPLVATLPGLLITRGEYAYFFPQEFVSWLVCCCWLFLIVSCFDFDKHFITIVRGLAILICIVSWLAIANSTTISEDFSLDVLNRESGTFGNPNYLAGYLVLQFPLLLICSLPAARHVIGGKWRLLFVIAALSGAVALLLTQGRAAQLTLLVCLMLLCGIMARWPAEFGVSRRLLTGIICIVFVLGLAVVVFLPVLDYVIERFRYGSTLSSRLVPWHAAWLSILDSPWYGWGSGSSYSLFFQYADPGSRIDWFQRRYPHAHNEYLEIWQEGGILALGSFIALTAYMGRTINKLLRSPDVLIQTKLFLTGISLGIFAYYVLATVSVAPRMITVKLIFFLLLAMVLLMEKAAMGSTGLALAKDSSSWVGKLSSTVPLRTVQASVMFLLIVCTTVYVSDASSRYRYVTILQETEGQQQITDLRALRDSNPNVYALNNLIQQELLIGDFASARISIGILNDLIPNYDNVGYLEAVAAIQANDLSAARELAERYQQRDKYHAKTALLLGKIALLQSEPRLFSKQLTLAITARLMQDAEFGKVGFEQLGTADEIIAGRARKENEVTFPLEIGELVLTQIMAQGRLALLQPDETTLREQYLVMARNYVAQTGYPEFNRIQRSAIHRQLTALLSDMVLASI